METNNILNADVLDIIFDGRNKQYGAYQLRKTYNKRLTVALAVMFCTCLMGIAGVVLAGNHTSRKISQLYVGPELTISAAEDKKPLPPPPPKPVEKIKVIADVPPVIVKEIVPPLPTQADMDDVTIGAIAQEGPVNGDAPAPPVETSTMAAKQPLVDDEGDGPVGTVQIQASFPGGPLAWRNYLQRNLRAEIASDNGAPAGTYAVVVSFVVDREGNMSEVKAENDPGFGTAAEAVRVIQKGPKWNPAIQNGRKVVYRQRQSIIFSIAEE